MIVGNGHTVWRDGCNKPGLTRKVMGHTFDFDRTENSVVMVEHMADVPRMDVWTTAAD